MKIAVKVARAPRAALTLSAAGLLVAAALTGAGTSAIAATGDQGKACSPSHATRTNHISGVVRAVPGHASCTSSFSDAAIGTPPLLYNGGPVMGTKSTGPVVVTNIYWQPAGHPITASYQNVLDTYIGDVAAASGSHTNVFSTATEYYGTNGNIRYAVQAGRSIKDTNPLPANGCKLNGKDTSRIYADGSGYDACLDDDQITAEIDKVTAGMPRDFGHIYVMFLPKHVESCFYGGSTTTASNFCTINYQPSAAYCAYHGQVTTGTDTIYANMPFPIYHSPVGYNCTDERGLGGLQAPNGDLDADVEVSPTSHEIMEAITDPDVSTGWYDSSGYENGDECAYVYGALQGTNGALYNQVINGHRYLTQEEFSNRDFARTGKGCLPGE